MIVLGIILGLPLALSGVIAGFTIPERLFGSGNPAGVRVMVAYFLFVTALLVFGLIFLAKSRANAAFRAFAITALATALGVFAICDPIALLGLR